MEGTIAERPMIGILAGMGPRSTSPFLEKVLDECVRQYGAELDSDFPPMMIHSLPTSFTLAGPLDHEAMRRSIRVGLRRLVDAHADVVAIPCNVAHRYFDSVTRGVEVPVLNLIEVTANAISQEEGASVTVLATRPTLDADLYGEAFRSRGLRVRDPRSYQELVDQIIGGVKRSWPQGRLASLWSELVDRILADDVESVVLGSTDLSAVDAAAREDRLRVVDSGGALARDLVGAWRGLDAASGPPG